MGGKLESQIRFYEKDDSKANTRESSLKNIFVPSRSIKSYFETSIWVITENYAI
jgi:hypothetical protein